mmetsp:Transcript_22388/g.34638  ORF Transcript_22388/g.34638 Transcript_22388/m.34638 type:complete len:109 (+) Transcript_22388:129-455(+)
MVRRQVLLILQDLNKTIKTLPKLPYSNPNTEGLRYLDTLLEEQHSGVGHNAVALPGWVAKYENMFPCWRHPICLHLGCSCEHFKITLQNRPRWLPSRVLPSIERYAQH